MNKQVKDKLVKALRSGDYKQTTGKLRDEGEGHCCLGVLCDLHSKETGTPWGEDGYYLKTDSWLPDKVVVWSGLARSGGLVDRIMINGRMMPTLIALNDDAKYSFNQIADVIEDQF